ncbi:MAG: pilus assembly protein PilM [Gammaproteobacteria bacterium]
MARLFKPRAKPLLGVDISSMAVKIIELSQTRSGYRVESYAVEPLPPNTVVERRIADEEAVGDAIRRAVKRSKTKTKEASVAVAGSAIISKVLTVPDAPNDDEMESQIQLEADKQIPFPIEEINFDFKTLGPSPKDPDRVDVLLVASRNENVDMRAAALELAGLKPRVVDVESYALEHACTLLEDDLPDGGEDRTIAVVDVGATMTLLNVLHNRETVYTREQQFGGKQLTEDIMRNFGLSHEEAGRMKRQGGLPDNYQPEVLQPFKMALTQQVNRALQYFLSSTDYSVVDHIVLCGGNAAIAGIDKLIEEQTGISCSVANPFAHMGINNTRVNASKLAADAPAMMIACGLALRAFD